MKQLVDFGRVDVGRGDDRRRRIDALLGGFAIQFGDYGFDGGVADVEGVLDDEGVDYAVAQICRWVQQSNQPLRYRDTAIIVRDLDVYHDLLRNALTLK